MFKRSFVIFILTVVCSAGLFFWKVVDAQVMQSSSYQIQNDSVNFSGGLSSSTTYISRSTAGEIASGPSDSTSFSIRAGYQQMQEVYLALSGGGNVTMNSSIPGIGGGIANGSTTVTAITDSPSGYQLTIEAEQSPAMVSGAYTIDDYVPSGSEPDLVFTVPASASEYAYSPFGSDVVKRFQTNGVSCNVSGSASSTACWDGLSTTPEAVAQSTSPNHPSGTDTTIYFRVGIGGSSVQTAGTYVATSTITLLAL